VRAGLGADPTASRTVLILENKGPAKMLFRDVTNFGKAWTAGIGTGNAFFVKGGKNNKHQLRLTQEGAFKIKRGSNTTMNLDTSGNLNIAGVLNAASSVAVKRDMVPVDGADVLTQLAALPVSTWRYKEDETEAQHLGPMAEAFHAAFGLGADDKHIAPTDMAGVALAAIKALQQTVQEKDAEITDLQERMAALEEKVGKLN
jgi:hypothetical protein